MGAIAAAVMWRERRRDWVRTEIGKPGTNLARAEFLQLKP
jgi:hypothetical protein